MFGAMARDQGAVAVGSARRSMTLMWFRWSKHISSRFEMTAPMFPSRRVEPKMPPPQHDEMNDTSRGGPRQERLPSTGGADEALEALEHALGVLDSDQEPMAVLVEEQRRVAELVSSSELDEHSGEDVGRLEGSHQHLGEGHARHWKQGRPAELRERDGEGRERERESEPRGADHEEEVVWSWHCGRVLDVAVP